MREKIKEYIEEEKPKSVDRVAEAFRDEYKTSKVIKTVVELMDDIGFNIEERNRIEYK